MLTRGLLLVRDVIGAFALQALHNVVFIAKLQVVETSPMSILLGDIIVNIDQLLGSNGFLKGFVTFIFLKSFCSCVVLTRHLSV